MHVCCENDYTEHLRPSGVFSCRPHSLELSPGFHSRPDHQCRLSDVCLKRTCSLDTSAFSALEVLDDNQALQIYLLTYWLQCTVAQFDCKSLRPPWREQCPVKWRVTREKWGGTLKILAGICAPQFQIASGDNRAL